MKNTFHLQYKYCGTFANGKYEELSYPKNLKMCNPILETLLKMQPYYSQSSCENVTQSSSTSLLASYKEVPPLPPRLRLHDVAFLWRHLTLFKSSNTIQILPTDLYIFP